MCMYVTALYTTKSIWPAGTVVAGTNSFEMSLSWWDTPLSIFLLCKSTIDMERLPYTGHPNNLYLHENNLKI